MASVGAARRGDRRGRPAGTPTSWPPPSATSKPGEMLDGEGGYTVWGKLLPAETSLRLGGLPLGLAHDVKVTRPVKKGQSLAWGDVAIDTTHAGLQDAARDGGLVRGAAAEDGVIDLASSRRAPLVARRQRRRAGPRRRRRRRRPHRRRRRAPRRRRAARTVDADGLALMPGIIDNHTHYDAQITWDPPLSPSPALGVTTAVIGNCGFTIAPCRPADRELMMRNLTQVEGMSLDVLRAGHRLGLRVLSRVPAQLRAARRGRQRRRLRRPLVACAPT